jgi:branched-chain amino acid aminotransferase
MVIYMNGKIVPEDEATVSVFDHGLLYGDGVFEGIRAYDGNIFRLKEHVERLFESAKTIWLDIGMTPEEVEQATADSVAASAMRDAYIRLVVTRGKGDLGIDPDKCGDPTFFIIVSTIALFPAEMYDQGIPVVTASTRRIPMECLDPRIKSLNYLNNILAKIEAKKAGVLEAVMLNQYGRVAECTADNIFIVKNGELLTPRVTEGALPGITRASVLELARETEIVVRETVLGLHDLYNANECFVTGTGAEIMPVIAIDGRQVGDGKPGPTTKRLLASFRELRTADGHKVNYEKQPSLTR